jgi:import receptor subunit TOM70
MLKLNPDYVKALNRRATALEQLGQYENALRDYTAATILDRFQNPSSAAAVERVLKVMASEKAKELIAKREPRLPSYTFISAYFAAFRPRAHPIPPTNDCKADSTLQLSLDALDAGDYLQAMSLINEAIEQGISWDEGKAEALNLRGTFK